MKTRRGISDELHAACLIGVAGSVAGSVAVELATLAVALAANAVTLELFGAYLCDPNDILECARTVAIVAAATLQIPCLVAAGILCLQNRRDTKKGA